MRQRNPSPKEETTRGLAGAERAAGAAAAAALAAAAAAALSMASRITSPSLSRGRNALVDSRNRTRDAVDLSLSLDSLCSVPSEGRKRKASTGNERESKSRERLLSSKRVLCSFCSLSLSLPRFEQRRRFRRFSTLEREAVSTEHQGIARTMVARV